MNLMAYKFDVYLKDKSLFTLVQGSPYNEDIIPYNFTNTKAIPVGKYLGKNSDTKLWGYTQADKDTLAITIRDCLKRVGVDEVFSVGPMHLICKGKSIKAPNGIGIVSKEGLSFFWMDKKAQSMLVIPNENVSGFTSGGKHLDIELQVTSGLYQKSWDLERISNQKFRIQPAIGSNPETNTIALTNFMTYAHWMHPYFG